MNRVIDYFKQYIGVISIVLAVCILLTYTFSHFVVTSDNHRSAEMYIGELKYSITIDGTNTNTLTVPSGETIVEMKINSLNSVDTYYKLLYQKDSNIEIKYYDKTLDTDEVATNYDSVNDKILANKTNNIKLAIQNNSSSDITITFKVSGGYITNTLADVVVPTNYSETSNLVTEKQYFCTTSDTLETGLIYVNGVYTYRYKKSGRGMNGLQFDLHWYDGVLSEDGWGVQYNNKESTDPVTGKVCTFINNKPIISMANMFFSTYSTSIDFSSFNTKRVITMESMFQSIEDYTKSPTLDAALSKLKELDLSNFDTSNVTDMSEMFSYNESLTTIYVSDKFVTDKVTNSSKMFSLCDSLVGGNGTEYSGSYTDKTYAIIDTVSTPGYFTLKN